MKRLLSGLVLPALLIAAAAAGCVATSKPKPAPKPKPKPAAKAPAKPAAPKVLPRFLELGSTRCIPCKAMMPIVEELEKKYKGKLKVEFIDVWEDEAAGKKYGVEMIPTQVFFDEKGKEFFRHTGFYPKEDILAAFKKHGIDLDKPAAKPAAKPAPKPASKTPAKPAAKPAAARKG